MHYIAKHRDVPTGANRVSVFKANDLAHAHLLMRAAHPNSVVKELRVARSIEVDLWNEMLKRKEH